MDMVKLRGLLLLAPLVLGACSDPFDPAQPEPPSAAGSVQSATRAESVPTLWAKGLVENNYLQMEILVGESFSASIGGIDVRRQAFVSCLDRIAREGSDTARFAWRDAPSSSSDSVVGDVDWTLVKSGGVRFSARSTWTVVRSDAAEWKLVRWSEPSSAGNWSDACGGF